MTTLPSSGWHEKRANDDFDKARAGDLWHHIASFFTLAHDELLPFDEVKDILKPSNARYTGLQTVPIDRIVGSEGRYLDFDSLFLPRRDHLKQRWTRIDVARYQDIILPPVQLYALGGVYFVRDGNHRISVARAKGQKDIDAEVTSLETEIALDPGMSLDEVKKRLIHFEKTEFYTRTHYMRITADDSLDFSEPGHYDLIDEHIRVHKYYINQHRTDEIGPDEAIWSWHEEVYAPVVLAIHEEGLLSLFPGRTASDLYLFLVSHWDELKQKYGTAFGLGDAARDLRKKLSPPNDTSGFYQFFQKIFKKTENS